VKDFFNKTYQLLFSYGANMNSDQILFRCNKPEVFSIARLPDHSVSFFGHSRRWDGGEETVISAPGEDTWGVIYKLSFRDLIQLDSWQDVRLDGTGLYFHFPTDVLTPEGTKYPVLVYKKDILGAQKPPSVEYLNYIIRGATERGLPSAYIQKLWNLQACPSSYSVPLTYTFDRSLISDLSCDCDGESDQLTKVPTAIKLAH